MLKKLLIFVLLFNVCNLTWAHYFVHSSTPGVKIEGSAGSSNAEKGKEVKANEFLLIPEGGEVEIYNDLDKNIYKSIASGKISVTRLMIDAKKAASDNSRNVGARLRFAKNNGNEDAGERIYVEKGMVRRSLEVFDPEANNLQVDSKTLAKKIVNFLGKSEIYENSDVALEVNSDSNDTTGVYFKIVNTLEYPVYFNVLKINHKEPENSPRVEISALGQPDGSYVLLPGQSLTKESVSNLPIEENHLLVLTHFRYDLDEVVEETGNLLDQQPLIEDQEIIMPLIIKKL